MKKILLLIASAAIALAVNAAPQKVDFGKLPKNSQEFIQKNFPGEKVKAPICVISPLPDTKPTM